VSLVRQVFSDYEKGQHGGVSAATLSLHGRSCKSQPKNQGKKFRFRKKESSVTVCVVKVDVVVRGVLPRCVEFAEVAVLQVEYMALQFSLFFSFHFSDCFQLCGERDQVFGRSEPQRGGVRANGDCRSAAHHRHRRWRWSET
jgi:hypothetical protein